MNARPILLVVALGMALVACFPPGTADLSTEPDGTSSDAALSAAGTWTEATPPDTPQMMGYVGLAHDTPNKQTIMFGGKSAVGAQQTWAYDGLNNVWRDRAPSIQPPDRRLHAMTFHEASKKTVLFGGFGNSGPKADTWTYDYATNEWTQEQPPTSPSARSGVVMAHDPVSGKLVLFGGSKAGAFDPASSLGDTWTYDGLTRAWTNITSPGSPAPRQTQAMATDMRTGKIVMFGGLGKNGVMDDTWLFDGATMAWTQANPATKPQARLETSMAATGPTPGPVMFGGKTQAGGFTMLGDTWTYEVATSTWTDLNPSGNLKERSGHSMALDASTGKTILFGAGGGSTIQQRGGMAAYDPVTNVWFDPNPPRLPDARSEHSMLYHAGIQRTLMYGGVGGWQGTPETWEYDSAKDEWRIRTPVLSPPVTAKAAMALEGSGSTVVLFGEADGLAESWHYDPVADIWSNVSGQGAQSPSRRWYPVMSSTGEPGRVMMFGGWNGVVRYDETWEHDVATKSWTQIQTTVSPGAIDSHAQAYDSRNGKIVLFGGWDGQNIVDGTWIYDPQTDSWRDAAPATSPPKRIGHSMVYDSKVGRIVIYGGWDFSNRFSDVWTYDVAANRWDHDSAGSGPLARDRHAMAFDTVAGKGVLFGGSDGSKALKDTWLFAATAGGPLPPIVTASDPSGGASAVPLDSNVIVTFDQDMDPTPTTAAFSISPAVAGGSATVAGKTLTWTHTTRFTPLTSYTVTISTQAKSLLGLNLAAPYALAFTTSPDNNPLPPKVAGSSPANGDVAIAVGAPVYVNFDQEMDPASTAGAFSISPAVTGGSATVTAATLEWTHSGPFAEATDYTVTISTTAKSKAGLNLGSPFTFSFRTVEPGQKPAPKVVATIPADGATGVATNVKIVVSFDQQMDHSATEGALTASPGVTGDFSWDPTGSDVTWSPDTPLKSGTEYTVFVSTAARSSAGMNLAAEHTFKFTTGSSADLVPPAIVHTPRGPAQEGKGFTIEARVTDDTSVASVELHYLLTGTQTEKSVAMSTLMNADYLGALPGSDVRAPKLQYYIVATDSSGNRARSPADESKMHSVEVKSGGTGGGGEEPVAGGGGLAWLALAVVVAMAALVVSVLAIRSRKSKRPGAGVPRYGRNPAQYGQWDQGQGVAGGQQWQHPLQQQYGPQWTNGDPEPLDLRE